MERKPRPLNQPVLNRGQWTHQIFLGSLVALGTLAVEARYESDGVAVAATLGFVVFALFNVALGLTSRDETGTVLRRDLVTDRRQLGLYGIALAVIVLSTELSITQRILDLVPLTGAQWMLCVGCSVVLLAIEEAIKFFLRRRAQTPAQPVEATAPVAA